STYPFLSAAQLVCAYTEAGHDRLARLDIATGKLTPVDLPYSDFGQIRAVGDGIVCRAGSPTDPPAIVLIDPATGASEMLRSSASALVEDELRSYISAPQHLSFPTENGLTAHANFFPPHNPDGLIGPYPEREELYRERSPVTHAGTLNCPVIFFQGADDRVVPPNQTEMMVEALRGRGIPVGYLLFAGEQHGFRRAETIKRALDAELYFYAALVFRTRLEF